jgi:aspartate/methionine/tyrosine aminotransferase
MVSGLNELPGFYCPPPTGGVHVFPDISGTKKTGMKLAEDLLENAGIAVLPGEIFGKSGKNHVRLSFATAEDNINESLIRLKERF